MNIERLLAPDYAAHPILDPDWLEKDPEGAGALRQALSEMSAGPENYNAHLNRLLRPWDDPRALNQNLPVIHSYLREVDLYLRELLQLVPPDAAGKLAPLAAVTGTNDLKHLLDLVFTADGKRARFEAQRKIGLARLFFDVDHTDDIQHGPAHTRALEECLARELWAHVTRARRFTVSFSLTPDGETIRYRLGPPEKGEDSWPVHLRRIARPVGGRPAHVHVFYHSCRFKRRYRFRTVEPLAPQEIDPDDVPIWEELKRGRSGSIVSKMIRKGEIDPQKIGDLIGAMFIVKDAAEVERLQAMLYDIFGGPFRWREAVDTIKSHDDRRRLHEQSAGGFQVKKSIVGVLHRPDDAGKPPYIFNVEFQIYTLEGFLKTVHSRHEASHERMKLRQFLEGLLPYLFPAGIYGEETLKSCLGK
ncbi:MAG TPA: hypothetical protein VF720_04405 [Candidatus Eisenbacteria bacterium]